MKAYLDVLRENRIAYSEQESMARHTSFRTGGPARVAVFPKTVQELTTALQYAPRERAVVLGNGSNVLFRDGGYDGVVVITTAVQDVSFEAPSEDGTVRVCAAAGTSLTGLAVRCQKQGLSGLEFAYGIPGTVGGAVYMNAGAYGGEMADVVTSSVYYDRASGEVECLPAVDHRFDYRFSQYMRHPNWTVLLTYLTLRPDDPQVILERMARNMESRRAKQPVEYPSAGSTFKRPDGRFVGQMTEECGLKGYAVGGAQLSEKHGGFVINRDKATASDLLAVIEHIEQVILDVYGVRLEREILVLGEE